MVVESVNVRLVPKKLKPTFITCIITGDQKNNLICLYIFAVKYNISRILYKSWSALKWQCGVTLLLRQVYIQIKKVCRCKAICTYENKRFFYRNFRANFGSSVMHSVLADPVCIQPDFVVRLIVENGLKLGEKCIQLHVTVILSGLIAVVRKSI